MSKKKLSPSLSLTGIIICLALLVTSQSVTGAPKLAGQWEGTIQIPGMALDVQIEFDITSDGQWQGTIDIPVQEYINLPLSEIAIDGQAVTFAIMGIPGDPTFNGVISPDNSLMSGDFTQNAQTFPFVLKLVKPADVRIAPMDISTITDELRSYLDTALAVWHVPGLSIAVVKDGKVIMAEGLGFREVGDSQQVTENTLFGIGSCTKAFTALAMGTLADKGLLDWDKPVRTYLPSFDMYDKVAADQMTPKDLVTHRSGLPRHDVLWYNSPLPRKELFARLKYLEPNADFRSRFQYQNLMYLAAGFLVGQMAGDTWESVVRQSILEPLAMEHTNFSVDVTVTTENFASPHAEEKGKPVKMPFRNIDAMGPAGSINSCAIDMANWMLLNLGNGILAGHRVVSPATLAELHSPHTTTGIPDQYPERVGAGYGIGWFVESYRGHRRLYHDGTIDGFSAMVSLLPDDGLGVVVLTNKEMSPLPQAANLLAMDLMLGLDPVDWHGRLRIASERATTIQANSKTDPPRVKGTKRSHDLREYAAEYQNKGYGVLTIAHEGGKLVATYNGLSGTLNHWHYDVFRFQPKGIPGGASFLLNFQSNNMGHISRLTVNFEPLADPILFERQPSPSMFSLEFLSRFAGRYELEGIIITIELKGQTLVSSIPGQPTHRLVPYRNNEFTLENLSGFSIEFIVDKEKGVTAALYKQPDGTFETKRLSSVIAAPDSE